MQYFKAGKLVAVHGLKGELILKHELGKKSSLKDVKAIFIEDKKDSFFPWFIETAKARSADEVLLKLETIDTREAAAKISQKEIWLTEEDFKKLSAKSVPSAKNSNVEELDYFTLKELSTNRGFIERYGHLLVEKEDEFGKTEILYFVEKGYQRKGMNPNFYTDFENDKLYFDLQTVLKAYQYLKADHINSLEELQLNFKKNFIENFVDGESIFFASW